MIVLMIRYLRKYFNMFKALSSRILLNSGKIFLIAGIKLKLLNVNSEDTEDPLNRLKTTFRELLKRVKRQDESYPYPARAWSRPIDSFVYKNWLGKDYAHNGHWKKRHSWTRQMNKLKECG